MDWMQLTIRINKDQADFISEVLMGLDALSPLPLVIHLMMLFLSHLWAKRLYGKIRQSVLYLI
ncbi:hypothetical protein [Isorropodon fossajaponicum symbiont]|uniref:hypothetical protein n=1 Tax=Isorropodon fossajaponicum symbiont TaxID=883811 RepID=UPI0019150000|nr:hypothetical protein [Isorropodon fossajaponicum symbiont]